MKGVKNDKLDYMIALAFLENKDSESGLLDTLDDSNVELSERYYKNKKKILNKYKRSNALKRFRSALPKVAIFLVAILSAATISIISISSLREAVFEAIVNWYETHFTIRFDVPEKETEETTEIETEPIIPPDSIEEVRKPTYLPDGVEEEMVYQSTTAVLYDYYLENELLYSFTQMVYNERDKYIDGNKAKVEQIYINESVATIVKYPDCNEIKIVWNDKEYLYCIIFLNLDFKEVIKIAESVQ